jgi:hypothetical protein
MLIFRRLINTKLKSLHFISCFKEVNRKLREKARIRNKKKREN